MRNVVGALLAAGSTLLLSVPAQAQPAPAVPGLSPLAPVATLDVGRYTGTWLQLAAVPQPFSLACARNTRATYSLLDARNIRVQNNCETWSGGRNEIVGNARVNDPVTNAQLHVSFPGVSSQDSPDGPTNYVVTYLADDYSWAFVGDPARFSGFVLSRGPAATAEQWRQIRAVVESRGYNSCLLLTTPTSGGSDQIRPLCTL